MAEIFVVLNDGETYTSVEGCKIIVVSDEVADLIAETSSVKGIDTLVTIPLDAFADTYVRNETILDVEDLDEHGDYAGWGHDDGEE